MTRNEHDANRAMHPKTYAQGYIDGQRVARNLAQRKRDQAALTVLYMWTACFLAGLALGLLWGAK